MGQKSRREDAMYNQMSVKDIGTGWPKSYSA